MGEYGEPWKVVVDKHDDVIFVKSAKDSYVCETFDVGDDVTMNRIAACVNALDGVPDEAIPMVAKLVELARTKSEKLADAYRELMMAMAVDMTKDAPAAAEEVDK